MTEQQANQEGLHFTGIYSSNKQEVKDRIAKERSLCPGARIVLVNSPHSRLSRSGPGMGYSAYADKVYSAYQQVESSNKVIGNYESNLAYHQKKFDDEKARLDAELKNATELLAKAREEIALAVGHY